MCCSTRIVCMKPWCHQPTNGEKILPKICRSSITLAYVSTEHVTWANRTASIHWKPRSSHAQPACAVSCTQTLSRTVFYWSSLQHLVPSGGKDGHLVSLINKLYLRIQSHYYTWMTQFLGFLSVKVFYKLNDFREKKCFISSILEITKPHLPILH